VRQPGAQNQFARTLQHLLGEALHPSNDGLVGVVLRVAERILGPDDRRSGGDHIGNIFDLRQGHQEQVKQKLTTKNAANDRNGDDDDDDNNNHAHTHHDAMRDLVLVQIGRNCRKQMRRHAHIDRQRERARLEPPVKLTQSRV
jgi:hypothetical protein